MWDIVKIPGVRGFLIGVARLLVEVDLPLHISNTPMEVYCQVEIVGVIFRDKLKALSEYLFL